MNYFQAVKLLDEVRDGHNHTFDDITKALELVGDIDADVCTDGTCWWRPSAKSWQARLLGETISTTGTGFSRHHSDDTRKN